MPGSWELQTRSSTYAVSLGLDDTVLVLDYFGPKASPVTRWKPPEVAPIMATYPDYAPVEYAVLGTRSVHASELIAEYADDVRGSDFRHADHEFDVSQGTSHLAVRFVDAEGIELVQHTLTRASSDVVDRWVVINDTRRSGEPVRLVRAFSGALNVHAPFGARLDYFAGAWMREMNPRSATLHEGTLRIGSRQGVTSHLFAPTVAISILSGDQKVDSDAGTIGCALAWSGSWAMSAEAHPNGLLRVSAGLQDEGTTFVLTPGRVIETPHLLMLHVEGGTQDLSRAWQRYQRGFLSRSVTPEHRPIVYNSWEATEFDVREDHQLELADIAADLGAEVFVVDDGWFAGRTDGNRALGDWTADPKAFPSGLSSFAQKILDRGMRFGLWIEPEAVSEDSEVFRLHPDWVFRNAGPEQPALRTQHVLNLGNPEAFEWIAATLRRLLRDHPISFLKWDMNRPITAPANAGFEWSFAHTNAYYRLLEMIRHEFPDVTVEACSGGGGRFDNKVLELADLVWTSDATGPRDRLTIQDGFLQVYPASVMSSWVTESVGVMDRAPASLAFRFIVAMAGVLGIGVDLMKWTHAEMAIAARMIELYRTVRPVIFAGELYRHSAPTDRCYALEYAGGREQRGRIVVLCYDSSRERMGPEPISVLSITPQPRIRISSADPNLTYRLHSDGSFHSGAELRSAGLVVPWAIAYDADVVILDPVAP